MKKILNRKTIFIVLMCVIWLCLIFYNGSRQGEISQSSSKEIIEIVSRFVEIPPATINELGIKFSDINFYVRKNAHFFEYLVLSIFMCSAARHFTLSKSTEIFLLLFLLLFFPVADEFIQKYIPGRTSNVLDIIIDFSGAMLGMILFNIGYKMHKKKVIP